MLSKIDLKAIKDLFRLELSSELKPLKQDVSTLKKDVSGIKKDILDIKLKINDFAQTTLDMLANIFDWSNDIHRNIVKEKLPDRVKKLEHIIKSS